MKKLKRFISMMMVACMAMTMVAGADGTGKASQGGEDNHYELQEFMHEFYTQARSNSKARYNIIGKEGKDFTNDYYDATAALFAEDNLEAISEFNFANVDSIEKISNHALDVTKSKIQYASLICNPITDVSKYDYITPKVVFKVTGNYAYQASITYNPNTNVISSYTAPVVIEQNFENDSPVPGTITIDSMTYSSQRGYPKLNESKTVADFQIAIHLWADFVVAGAIYDRIDYGQRISPMMQIDAQ